MIFMKLLSVILFTFFAPGIWSSGIKNACKYSIDEKPVVRIDDHMQGIWKMAEDTDSHNYLIIEKDGDFAYCITYMNRSGDNRGLEHGQIYFSQISNVKFIVIYNWDDDYRGFLFYRIDNIDQGSWDVTARLVIDPSIRNVKSRDELRTLLEKNLNNQSFYGKELHFEKKFEFNSCHG
jgi:hypothetical protein